MMQVRSRTSSSMSMGQLAMQELMADKSVAGQMGMFERFVDKKKLADVVGVR